jgi:hypothetical protein
MTGRFDWLDGLDDEDLRCAGLHRDNEWKAFEREIAAEKAIAGAQTGPTPPAPKPPRIRRPSLESQVRQLLKAAQVAGVQIAVTVEGDKVTATPVRGSSPANREDPTHGSPPADAAPGRALFKARAVPKVKVVL